MTELCDLLEVKKTNTAPYRPQSDGLVERFNRTLIAMLSKLCTDKQTDWDTHLPYIMCAYRATRNESTGFSPNHLFLGREVTLPIDLMYRNPDEVPYGCQNEYVEWVTLVYGSYEHVPISYGVVTLLEATGYCRL